MKRERGLNASVVTGRVLLVWAQHLVTRKVKEEDLDCSSSSGQTTKYANQNRICIRGGGEFRKITGTFFSFDENYKPKSLIKVNKAK
jgi:hypothetical protein